jgi:hypothetical protein
MQLPSADGSGGTTLSLSVAPGGTPSGWDLRVALMEVWHYLEAMKVRAVRDELLCEYNETIIHPTMTHGLQLDAEPTLEAAHTAEVEALARVRVVRAEIPTCVYP